MEQHFGAIIAACALVFSIATTVLGIMQRLSTSQLKAELGAIELKLRKAIAEYNNEIDERVDRQARDFGETAQAIRAHINIEVTALRKEITDDQRISREIFTRRDNFDKMTEELSASIGKLGDKIESRLERMEGKINHTRQTKV